MDRLDWDDLRFVLVVAETGSVSAAGRRLKVNHATVLRRVAQAELALGTQIFERSPRGYLVAPEKLRLVEALRDAGQAIAAVRHVAQGIAAPARGRIRLTSTDTFCLYILPGALARVAESAPGLLFDLQVANGHVDLARLQADLTVRPAIRLPEDLEGSAVAQLGFGHYRPIDAAPDLPWVGLSGALALSRPAAWMAETLPPDSLRGAADSFTTLRELVARGQGQSILPCVLAEGDPRLQRQSGVFPDFTVPVWVAAHADLARVPRIATARNLLADALRHQAKRLATGRD